MNNIKEKFKIVSPIPSSETRYYFICQNPDKNIQYFYDEQEDTYIKKQGGDTSMSPVDLHDALFILRNMSSIAKKIHVEKEEMKVAVQNFLRSYNKLEELGRKE